MLVIIITMLPTIKLLFSLNNFQKPLSQFTRFFNSSSPRKINKNDFKEVKIPVPWGHIAGKWWGNTDVQPVLALHGVQDNAATFDKLVPLLNVDAVLAVDIPGHGWSSHIPRGFPYDIMDAVCIVRLIVKDYYKWAEPLTLLGHSFGSALSFVYAYTYRDEVSKYISIDCSRHIMSNTNNSIESMKNTMEKLLQLEDKSNPPEYSYEELLEVLYQGRKARLTKESCEVLLSRGMSKLDNGKVYLSRDVRIKLNGFGAPTPEQILFFASGIKCNVLSIQASGGTVRDDSKGDLYRKTIELMLKNSPYGSHVILEGNHHLHLDNPKPVADVINNFFSELK